MEWVCTDMWRPFKRSFAQYLPNAKLVIDKFHVVKILNEALDKVRNPPRRRKARPRPEARP